ncbi:hypothetical protein KEM55_004087 [Ascosphaera atra]|nr:hypothetical protein KEM55_004087 [Ascosphaera atra]
MNPQHEQEPEGDAVLDEADIETLLREQQQQFAQELAQAQKEQQRLHEQELAELRRTYEANLPPAATHNVSNHAQPPVQPTTIPATQQQPYSEHGASTLATNEILELLRSLQFDVAKLKRAAPQGEPSTEEPPSSRRRTDNQSLPSDRPTSSIPGLPVEVSEAVYRVVQDLTHPAYKLSPEEVATLCFKCRPQGISPRDKLSSASPQDYQSWDFTLHEKFARDWPLFLTEHEKTSYALSFLEGDLFVAMQGWLTDLQPPDHSLPAFREEIKTTLGIHYQATDAKKELDSALMSPNETVTAYHARLRALWIRAATSEMERLTKFRASLLPSLADPLMGRPFSSTNELLQAAREVGNYRKQCQLDCSRSSAAQQTLSYRGPCSRFGRSDTCMDFKSSTSPAPRLATSTPSCPYSHDDLEYNKKFGPITTKPAGWRGPWRDAETKPQKMNNALRRQLSNQQRCWSCRGSRHQSNDSCCPFTSRQQSKSFSAVSTNIQESSTDQDSPQTINQPLN